MRYYEISPSDRTYQGTSALTYSYPEDLEPGRIVVVTLRTKNIPAIILKRVGKPEFKTKNISGITNIGLTPHQLKLFAWITAYYPSGLGAIAGLFVPSAMPKNETLAKKSAVSITTKKMTLPALTSQQDTIIRSIESGSAKTHILHGDTGTGKTRVYIELVRKIVAQQKSALVLTPEINLTPQLAEQFNSQFPNVFVVHSGLTAAQRRTIWLSVRSSREPVIVLGPRSALFYPVDSLGIIIIDEFQDSAYKQEQSPRYHALRVAGYLAEISGSKLILGSATPPVEDYFYATSKGALVHRLTEKPITATAVKDVKIINLNNQNERSRYPLLTNSLLSLIQKSLEQKHQILLFLNKRGTARSILCQNCGWFAECDRCNIAYTYHHDSHQLVCHTCNQRIPAPNSCPRCSSENILFKNPGTKSIVESLSKLFPNARIGRYDKDNKKSETFSANKAKISAGDIDILVGTQLLVKGHDLPNLNLVGILLAESSLQFPDFTATERTFNLLHQIAGRVGRAGVNGMIALQTYEPDNPLLQHVFQHDNAWTHFYRSELKQRREYNFPPYVHLLKIEIARKTENASEKFAQRLAESLRADAHGNVEILGPSPAFIYKSAGLFRWHIVIKSTQRKLLIDIIKNLPKSCTHDIDPSNLL